MDSFSPLRSSFSFDARAQWSMMKNNHTKETGAIMRILLLLLAMTTNLSAMQQTTQAQVTEKTAAEQKLLALKASQANFEIKVSKVLMGSSLLGALTILFDRFDLKNRLHLPIRSKFIWFIRGLLLATVVCSGYAKLHVKRWDQAKKDLQNAINGLESQVAQQQEKIQAEVDAQKKSNTQPTRKATAGTAPGQAQQASVQQSVPAKQAPDLGMYQVYMGAPAKKAPVANV